MCDTPKQSEPLPVLDINALDPLDPHVDPDFAQDVLDEDTPNDPR